MASLQGCDVASYISLWPCISLWWWCLIWSPLSKPSHGRRGSLTSAGDPLRDLNPPAALPPCSSIIIVCFRFLITYANWAQLCNHKRAYRLSGSCSSGSLILSQLILGVKASIHILVLGLLSLPCTQGNSSKSSINIKQSKEGVLVVTIS